MMAGRTNYHRDMAKRDERGHGAMKAQIHEKLKRFGVTGAGRDWLLRALHPAGEDDSPGFPDQSATSVLRPDIRVQTTISAPDGASSWDCILWTPPGDVNAVYWATGPAGIDFTTQTAPAGCEVGVLRLQNSVQSTTGQDYILFSDGVTTVGTLTQVGAFSNSGFRHQFKSITVHQIASAVADQGQVFAAQFAPQFTNPGQVIPIGYDSGVPDPRVPPPGANFALIGELYQTVLPAAEADMAAMSPDLYMGESREGVYLPLRLAGPTQPFNRAKPHSTAFQAGGAPLWSAGDTTLFSVGALIQPTQNLPDSGGVSIPWPFRAVATYGNLGPMGTPLTIPGGIQLDSGFDNMNIGVVIFRGLAGGGGGSFGASLQVKCNAGLEIPPNPGASSRAFTESAAAYDPLALQAYYTLVMELRGAYPASYNGFGDIWDAIKSAASSVWHVFQPALSSAAPALVDAAVGAATRGLAGLASGGMLTGARRGGSLVKYRSPSTGSRASKLTGARNPGKQKTRAAAARRTRVRVS